MVYQEIVRAATRELESTHRAGDAAVAKARAFTGIGYALLALAQAVADRPTSDREVSP